MRFRSRETFDANRDEIELAVQLLIANSKRRNRFQVARVYERNSDELLAEVLMTGFGPVVAYSAVVGGVMANWTGSGSESFMTVSSGSTERLPR